MLPVDERSELGEPHAFQSAAVVVRIAYDVATIAAMKQQRTSGRSQSAIAVNDRRSWNCEELIPFIQRKLWPALRKSWLYLGMKVIGPLMPRDTAGFTVGAWDTQLMVPDLHRCAHAPGVRLFLHMI
mmetsp:Transcript_53179/g.172991  ORF Transcript_53179/g.172991 Transcript_53179/m.172991 type:complete len:127 (-) Transcript_53179:178-558(-)